MSVAIIFFTVIFIAVFITGGLEIVKDTMNPLPKFENGDKRIEHIAIKKTRKITLK